MEIGNQRAAESNENETMSVRIKICGITNVDDGLAAIQAGADALGFMFFEKSSRFVTNDQAREISKALPPLVARVGVFVNSSPDLVNRTIEACGIDTLQFHGDETPEFCHQFGLKTIKAFRVKDATSLVDIERYATDAWLLDAFVPGQLGGTGAAFNWELAAEAISLNRPVILAGGLTSKNVARAVEKVRPFALDVSSGVESEPGKKDHQKMREFIREARGETN